MGIDRPWTCMYLLELWHCLLNRVAEALLVTLPVLTKMRCSARHLPHRPVLFQMTLLLDLLDENKRIHFRNCWDHRFLALIQGTPKVFMLNFEILVQYLLWILESLGDECLTWMNVVARDIGVTTAQLLISGSDPAWTTRVSNRSLSSPFTLDTILDFQTFVFRRLLIMLNEKLAATIIVAIKCRFILLSSQFEEFLEFRFFWSSKSYGGHTFLMND